MRVHQDGPGEKALKRLKPCAVNFLQRQFGARLCCLRMHLGAGERCLPL